MVALPTLSTKNSERSLNVENLVQDSHIKQQNKVKSFIFAHFLFHKRFQTS